MSIAAIIAICLAVGFGAGSGTAAAVARARAQMNCLERSTAAGLDRSMSYRVCSRGRIRAAARAYRRGRV